MDWRFAMCAGSAALRKSKAELNDPTRPRTAAARSDPNDACNKDGCLASVRGRVDSYNSLRPLSTIGFVAGAALGGVGLALILSDDKRADSQRGARPTQLVVGLDAGRATLRGSF